MSLCVSLSGIPLAWVIVSSCRRICGGRQRGYERVCRQVNGESDGMVHVSGALSNAHLRDNNHHDPRSAVKVQVRRIFASARACSLFGAGGSMKRMLCLVLVATLQFGSAFAEAPKEKNVKISLVYQHELPNVPGKSIND